MTYKDISDIPLKPPTETFVDDPTSIEDVTIDEIIFDITHGIKDINKLHVFHAIVILSQTLQDIIKLQAEPALFHEFRNKQLAKYSISMAEASSSSSHSNVTTPPPPPPLPIKSDIPSSHFPYINTSESSDSSPPSSPPLKFTKLNNFREFSLHSDPSTIYTETTPESQDDESNDNAPPPYVPIEELLKTTSLDVVSDPIDSPSPERFKHEFLLCQQNKKLVQNSHLLKSFNLLKLPSLSLQDFLLRIKTYSSSISVSSYIHSASMMFKLAILLDIVPLTKMNVYRFALASIRCSAKNLEDVYQKQKSFATVGGVSTKDLYKIEVGFLYLCNFKLIIGESLLNQFLSSSFLDLRNFCKEKFNESEPASTEA